MRIEVRCNTILSGAFFINLFFIVLTKTNYKIMANARILFGGDENHAKTRFRVFRNDKEPIYINRYELRQR